MRDTKGRELRPVLKADRLYLGDNGRCFCGEHAGCSAKYTGRDLSGQEVLELTYADVKAEGIEPDSFQCETPRCEVRIRMVLPVEVR